MNDLIGIFGPGNEKGEWKEKSDRDLYDFFNGPYIINMIKSLRPSCWDTWNQENNEYYQTRNMGHI